MGFLAPKTGAKGAGDPILTRLAAEDKVPWYKKRNLRFLYFLLFPTCMCIEATSGFDSQMMNALQIVPAWQTFFGKPTAQLKGIITASYSLGAIISLPFVPYINDRFGRRWSIMIGSIIQCVGAIVQCFAINTGMYIGSRIILGFGIPACIIAGSSLIGELSYPKERPVMTSLFNVAYYPGAIIAAAIVFGTNSIPSNWSWRLPSILQLSPSLIQIGCIFFLPESPRWLVSKDRSEEAYDILIKYHAEGNADSEFVRAEMAQIRSTLALEMDVAKQSWVDMIRTAGMRKRVLIASMLGLFTQWSGNTLISYYLNDILNMIGTTKALTKQRINVAKSCNDLIWAFAAAMCVLRFKRRVMYMACVISLLVVYICWTISMERTMTAIKAKRKNTSAATATLFFIFAYAPAYNTGYNALSYTYLVELFPYAERSRGIAIFQFFGRGAGFASTFINPIGLDNIGWKYLISYCCWLGFEVVFVWFMFPETSGRTLEELAFLFEDKALADQAVHAVEKVVNDVDIADTGCDSEKARPGTRQEHIECVDGASNKV